MTIALKGYPPQGASARKRREARKRINLTTETQLKLTEREVTRQVLDFMRVERWLPIRLNSGLISTPDGRRIKVGSVGLPDYIFVRSKEYVFVEFKAPGKPLRPAQRQWFEFAAREGYPAIVADGLGSFLVEYRRRWPS